MACSALRRCSTTRATSSLPTLCDIDTGFGSVTNVKRATREFEQIGAAGVHMED